MRLIRYILDLPWWVGLAIFMAGNWLVPHTYIIGVPVCLFGAWTFSKLLKPDDYADVGSAIIGFPLFFLVMLVPNQFSFETVILDLLNDLSTTATFAIRAALGIFTGFIAFQGVRK